MKNFFKKIIVFIITCEARLVLWKYKPRIVGITGSVGKTSTKDAIFTVLSSAFYVRKSQKSFNSEVGVPLTILGLENAWSSPWRWFKNIFKGLGVFLFPNHYPKWLVLELGVDKPGDMPALVSWLKLDVAVLTYIGDLPVHVEFFNSIKQLIREKHAIVDGLRKDGILILNNDDEHVAILKENSKHRTYTYGVKTNADMCSSHYQIMYHANAHGHPYGINFKVNFQGSVVPVTLEGILGEHHIYPSLAALTVGMSQGLHMVEMTAALSKLKISPGRMRLLEGMHNTTVIDDSYNASPVAVSAALQTLANITTAGRKIVVLGDMMELGKYSPEAHQEIGREVVPVADMFIAVGTRSKATAKAAEEAGMKDTKIQWYSNSVEAGEAVRTRIKEGDVVLVKGSQSLRLEKIVEKIMAHPEERKELLVRQSDDWLER